MRGCGRSESKVKDGTTSNPPHPWEMCVDEIADAVDASAPSFGTLSLRVPPRAETPRVRMIALTIAELPGWSATAELIVVDGAAAWELRLRGAAARHAAILIEEQRLRRARGADAPHPLAWPRRLLLESTPARALLRLDGGLWLSERCTLDPTGRIAGRLRVPFGSEQLIAGRSMVVEVGLGAGVDAVELAAIAGGGRSLERSDEVDAEVVASHADRLRYLLDVLAGLRAPTQRRERRRELRLPVSISDGPKGVVAYAESWSSHGCFVRRPPIADGCTRMLLKVRPYQGRGFQVEAVVVWESADPHRPGYGVEFVDLSPYARRALARIMGDEGN